MSYENSFLTKTKNHEEALFYIQKTIENNWSRTVLTHQIESCLFQRAGKAVTNFEAALPEPQSDLALQPIKDPYNFDFLNLREKHDERELEDALIGQITRFLLELGAGFSFIGRQQKLTIEEDDFYIDLLFYHTRLHCYVVVELKTSKFKPEYAGKLNFYVSAVDSIMKTEQDNPSVGMLICKSKNKTVKEVNMPELHDQIIPKLKTEIEQNGEQFIATVSKLTAMTALIRQYEPAGHDEVWEAFQRIAQIIEEITDECYTFLESMMEIFQSLDNCLCELFGIEDIEEQSESTNS